MSYLKDSIYYFKNNDGNIHHIDGKKNDQNDCIETMRKKNETWTEIKV